MDLDELAKNLSNIVFSQLNENKTVLAQEISHQARLSDVICPTHGIAPTVHIDEIAPGKSDLGAFKCCCEDLKAKLEIHLATLKP